MARRFLALPLAAGLVLSCETEPSGSGQDEVETPQVCKDYCEVDVACTTVEAEECEEQCTLDYQAAAAIGGFCPQSFQGLLACVAELDCDEHAAWLEGAPGDTYPCSEQDSAYNLDCG
jgi:hypothetical protein